MEVQNVPDGTDRGRKRKATGHECMKRRQVIVEEQLEVKMKEKDVLVTLLEQEKGHVRELTKQLNDTKIMVEEQKRKVISLTDELMNTESRVMHLEADKYFLGADLQEKGIEEAQLKQKCTQLELMVDKLSNTKRCFKVKDEKAGPGAKSL
jgi:hypothetical protein